MRITEGMLTDNFLSNYDKISNKQAKIQTQLATNSKINTISDDVNGALESIKVEMQIKKNESYVKNGQNAKDFNTATLNAMDTMVGEIQKIFTTLTSAQNPINVQNYPTMLQSIKDSLEAIAESVNTKKNNMYLFGGTNYTEPPVTIDSNSKAVTSTADLSGEVNVQLSQNVNLVMNVPGSKIFATDMFTSINSLIDSFAAGNAPTQAQIDTLTKSYNNLLNLQSLSGQKENRIDDINNLLTTQKLNLDTMMTNISGIDSAKLLVDLQNQDYLLQVVQKVLTQTYPKSIFDYL